MPHRTILYHSSHLAMKSVGHCAQINTSCTPVYTRSLICLGINSEDLKFPHRAIGCPAKIFNRKCKKIDQNKDLDGICSIRHSQGGNKTTDVVFQFLSPTSSWEAIREASVIDPRCLESISTGWFGSHYNLQSVV